MSSLIPTLSTASPRRKVSNLSKFNRPRMKSKSRFSAHRNLVLETPIFLPDTVEQIEVPTASNSKAKTLFKACIDDLCTKEEKTCVRALQELYLSEAKYVEDLQHLANVKEIVRTFRQSVPDVKDKRGRSTRFVPMVPETDLNALFINIKTLQQVHKRIISGLNDSLAALYDGIELTVPSLEIITTKISAEYTKLAPFWAMYTLYIKQFETAVSTMQKLKKGNLPLVQKFSLLEEAYNQTLSQLINKPLQRITKYPLLFHSIQNKFKKLMKKHSENTELPRLVAELARVTEIIHKAVNNVNVKVGLASDVNELGRINSEIGSQLKTFELLQPWRRVKLETTLDQFEFGTQGAYTGKCILFVFNDYIVVAGHNKRSKSITSNNFSSSMFRRSVKRPKSSQVSAPSLRKSQRFNVSSHTLRRINRVSVRSTMSRNSTRRKLLETPTDEESVVRKLFPLAEMKITNLRLPTIEKEKDQEENSFALHMIYNDDINDTTIKTAFYFTNEKKCLKLRDLIIRLQKEHQAQLAQRQALN